MGKIHTKGRGIVYVNQPDPEPDLSDDDFEIIRAVINLVRRYPKSKATFIRSEIERYYPGTTDGQIARCCEFITSRWSAPMLRELANKR